MKYLIGVDLGTQSTKSTIYSENGVVTAHASEDSRLIYPETWAVEQDPEEMLTSVLSTIKQMLETSKISPNDIAAIGISGQMAGTMGIDKSGMAVTPYDSWLDMRCGKYRGKFLDYGEEKVIAITGAPVTYAHGPKVLWWKYERPEVYEKIYKFIPPAAYCTMRMCGLAGDDAFIDHTYLHFTGFADTEKSKWSSELLTAMDIDSDKMPRIVKPSDKVGALTAEMAARCGLISGIPIVAGCGDTAASSFGAGIIRRGLLFDVAGTASVFACATDVYAPDTKRKTIMFAKSVSDGLYTPMAYINGGGMCLKWFRDEVLAKAKTYQELDELAKKIPAGSENLLFLPHFSGRVCPNDALVRGSYINLSWQHKTAHMFRAILEGIAYEYRIYADIIHELVPDLTFERVISVGGGSVSPLFCQIKADVLGTPISKINLSDTAVLASCSIAGHGVGLFEKVSTLVENTVKLTDTTTPDAELFDFYGKRSEIYANVFHALHGVYSQIATL